MDFIPYKNFQIQECFSMFSSLSLKKFFLVYRTIKMKFLPKQMILFCSTLKLFPLNTACSYKKMYIKNKFHVSEVITKECFIVYLYQLPISNKE